MPTNRPRITVSLDPQTYAVLKAISECGGQPMSAFISEMMDSARPTLERMAATFQKIKAAQDNERARFLNTVDEAQAVLEPVVMQAVDQFDLFLGQIGDAVSGAGTATVAAIDPPTNRGVTPTSPIPPKAKRSKPSKPVSSGKVLKKTRG